MFYIRLVLNFPSSMNAFHSICPVNLVRREIIMPPPHVISRLHKSNFLIVNMVGAPRHAKYALEAVVDLIYAQRAEGEAAQGVFPVRS